MKALRVVLRFVLLIGLGIQIPASPATAQTTSPTQSQPPAPGLRKLTGDDAKRAEELDKATEAAQTADCWDEAIAKADELLALRVRAQGPKHFETVNAEWRLNTLRRTAPMSKEDRVAYRSANTMNEHGETFTAQRKHAQAQPLYEKALQIRRRLLTDDHPDTATSYNNLATSFTGQGKHAQAQPWPPCWPGLVSRVRPGSRWRKTWAAACSTSWSPARTSGSRPPSETACAN